MLQKKHILLIYLMLLSGNKITYTALARTASEALTTAASDTELGRFASEFNEAVWGQSTPPRAATPHTQMQLTTDDMVKIINDVAEEEKLAEELGNIERDIHERTIQKTTHDIDEEHNPSDSSSPIEIDSTTTPGIPLREIPQRVRASFYALGERVGSFLVPGLQQFSNATNLHHATLHDIACTKLLAIEPTLSECQSAEQWQNFITEHPELIRDLNQTLYQLKSKVKNKDELIEIFPIESLKTILHLEELPGAALPKLTDVQPTKEEEISYQQIRDVTPKPAPPMPNKVSPPSSGMLRQKPISKHLQLFAKAYKESQTQYNLHQNEATVRDKTEELESIERDNLQESQKKELINLQTNEKANKAATKIQSQVRARQARKETQKLYIQKEIEKDQHEIELSNQINTEIETYLSKNNPKALNVFQQHKQAILEKYPDAIESIKKAIKEHNVSELKKWNNVVLLRIETDFLPTNFFIETEKSLATKLPKLLKQLKDIVHINPELLTKSETELKELLQQIHTIKEKINTIKAPSTNDLETFTSLYEQLSSDILKPEEIDLLVQQLEQIGTHITMQMPDSKTIEETKQLITSFKQKYHQLQISLQQLDTYKKACTKIIEQLPAQFPFEEYLKTYDNFKNFINLDEKVVQLYRALDEQTNQLLPTLNQIKDILTKSSLVKEFINSKYDQAFYNVTDQIIEAEKITKQRLPKLQELRQAGLKRAEDNKPEVLLVKNKKNISEQLKIANDTYKELQEILKDESYQKKPIRQFYQLTEALYKKIDMYNKILQPSSHSSFKNIDSGIVQAIEQISEANNHLKTNDSDIYQSLTTTIKAISDSIQKTIQNTTDESELTLEQKSTLRLKIKELDLIKQKIDQYQLKTDQYQTLLKELAQETSLLKQLTIEESNLQSLHSQINSLLSALSNKSSLTDAEYEHIKMYRTLHVPRQKEHLEMIQNIQKILQSAKKLAHNVTLEIEHNIRAIEENTIFLKEKVTQQFDTISTFTQQRKATQQNQLIEQAFTEHSLEAQKLEERFAKDLEKAKIWHKNELAKLAAKAEQSSLQSKEHKQRSNIIEEKDKDLEKILEFHQQAIQQDKAKQAQQLSSQILEPANTFAQQAKQLPNLILSAQNNIKIITELIQTLNKNNSLSKTEQTLSEYISSNRKYLQTYYETYEEGKDDPEYLLELLEELIAGQESLQTDLKQLPVQAQDIQHFLNTVNEYQKIVQTIKTIEDQYYKLALQIRKYNTLIKESYTDEASALFKKKLQEILHTPINIYKTNKEAIETISNFGIFTLKQNTIDLNIETFKASLALDNFQTIAKLEQELDNAYKLTEQRYQELEQQELRELQAATKIQSQVRARKARKELQKLQQQRNESLQRSSLTHDALEKIDDLEKQRDHEVEALYKQFKQQETDIIHKKAATQIQTQIRALIARNQTLQMVHQRSQATQNALTEKTSLNTELINTLQQLHQQLTEQAARLQLQELQKGELLKAIAMQENSLRTIIETHEEQERASLYTAFKQGKDAIEQQELLKNATNQYHQLEQDYNDFMKQAEQLKASEQEVALSKLQQRLAQEAYEQELARQLMQQEHTLLTEEHERQTIIQKAAQQLTKELAAFQTQLQKLQLQEEAKTQILQTLHNEQHAAQNIVTRYEELNRLYLESLAFQHDALKQLQQQELAHITQKQEISSKAADQKKQFTTKVEHKMDTLYEQFIREKKQLEEQELAQKIAKEQQKQKEEKKRKKEAYDRKREQEKKQKEQKKQPKTPKSSYSRPLEIIMSQGAELTAQRAKQEAIVRQNILEGRQATDRKKFEATMNQTLQDLYTEEEKNRKNLEAKTALALISTNKQDSSTKESEYYPPTIPVKKPKASKKTNRKTGIGAIKITTPPTTSTHQPPQLLHRTSTAKPAPSATSSGHSTLPTPIVTSTSPAPLASTSAPVTSTSKTSYQSAQTTPDNKTKRSYPATTRTVSSSKKQKSIIIPTNRYQSMQLKPQLNTKQDKKPTQSHNYYNEEPTYYDTSYPLAPYQDHTYENFAPDSLPFYDAYNYIPYQDENMDHYEWYNQEFENQQPLPKNKLIKTTSSHSSRSTEVTPDIEFQQVKKMKKKIQLDKKSQLLPKEVINTQKPKELLPRKGRIIKDSTKKQSATTIEFSKPIQEQAEQEEKPQGFIAKIIESTKKIYESIKNWIWQKQ